MQKFKSNWTTDCLAVLWPGSFVILWQIRQKSEVDSLCWTWFGSFSLQLSIWGLMGKLWFCTLVVCWQSIHCPSACRELLSTHIGSGKNMRCDMSVGYSCLCCCQPTSQCRKEGRYSIQRVLKTKKSVHCRHCSTFWCLEASTHCHLCSCSSPLVNQSAFYWCRASLSNTVYLGFWKKKLHRNTFVLVVVHCHHCKQT